MKLKIPDNLRAIKPYVPGKPIEEVQREYGIDHSIKLASNENPFGPSPMALAAINEVLGNLHRYPDAGGYALIHAIAEKYNIEYLIGHYEYTLFEGHELWLEKDDGYRTEKEDPGPDFMKEVRKATKNLNFKPIPN